MAKRSTTAGKGGPKAGSTIKAAGGVVWRDGAEGREVLLVHRPKYDDWSLPKGKRTANEPAPLAAVREIAEETGCHVRLGPRLPTAYYQVLGVPKEVRYWLADPIAAPPFEPNDEVDEIAWVSRDEAKARVRAIDHALVRRALPRAQPSRPLLVLRHALSMRRKEWKGDDRDRPLTREGLGQAGRLADLLAAWAPTRVVTSSSRRCRDTVAPLAAAMGIELELADELSEESFKDDPKPARALVAGLRDSADPVVLCTHRPLMATMARSIGLELPRKARANPLPKGAFWVAHPGSGREVERYTP